MMHWDLPRSCSITECCNPRQFPGRQTFGEYCSSLMELAYARLICLPRVVAIEKGVHSEFGTAILFTQENGRCLHLDTLHGLSEDEALWFKLRAWARFQPRATRPRTDTGLMFYQAVYLHVFEMYWDVLENPLVHPEAAGESDFTKACMSDSQAALDGLSLTAPLVDSEAPEGCQFVAKQAAVSRLCMVQDVPDKWAEMVDRSSPCSDGPASLCGSGVGTDLVPGLGLTDTCVPCGHPSKT
jgi:hypothetical protein